MKMNFVRYEANEKIGVITIDNPKVNSLNSEVLDELDEVLNRVDLNEILVLIITGAGEKCFVAGADIDEMANMSKTNAEGFSKKGNDIFRRIETFPIPVIAAVNGVTLGGGCELAMCCDIRIASTNAVFGQPEVGLGIIPGFGGTQRLSRIVGVGMAKQLIYTASRINADEALKIGLISAIYPQENLMYEAEKMAKEIMKSSSEFIQGYKKDFSDN